MRPTLDTLDRLRSLIGLSRRDYEHPDGRHPVLLFFDAAYIEHLIARDGSWQQGGLCIRPTMRDVGPCEICAVRDPSPLYLANYDLPLWRLICFAHIECITRRFSCTAAYDPSRRVRSAS